MLLTSIMDETLSLVEWSETMHINVNTVNVEIKNVQIKIVQS